MSTQINRIVTLIFVCILGIYSQSKAQFTLSAELRPRAEFRHGFKTLRWEDDDPAFFIEQRTRLNADYQGEKYRLHISAQDIRIWGGTDQIYKSDDALFNLYEAWAEYYLSDIMALKIGRQSISYDNERFMGGLGWAQQARSHDALLFLLEDNGLKFHAGVAYNQDYDPIEPAHLFGTEYGNNNYKTMQYAWFHNDFEGADLSLIFQNDGRQYTEGAESRIVFRQTLGAIGSANFDNLKVGGEFYAQTGKNANNVDVSAYLVAINATLNTGIAAFTAGVDYLSGTRPGSNTDNAFAPLYGTNHKFYGFMDYFYVGNNHGQSGRTAGLVNPYIRANIKFDDRNSLRMDLHHFFSGVGVERPFPDNDNNASSSLGTEFDMVYARKISDDIKLNMGYSVMAAGESMELLKGRGNSDLGQHWAFFMFSVSPTLFTTSVD